MTATPKPTRLDRLIRWLSPTWGLRRAQARRALAELELERDGRRRRP